MKKILILGSAGMLGHMVYNYLVQLKKYDIVDASFNRKAYSNSYILDITDKLAVETFIKVQKPDLVINCIGVLIQGSQKDPSNAIYINSYLPHQLSKLMCDIGGKLIHISTDCVFSGKKGNYIETDFRDADDTYGRSKALGEVINNQDLTIRTSIIGPELKVNGEGLFHWFMKQTGEINGFTKAYWGGVTTLELAKIIDAAIEQKAIGLINISNGEKINKYDLLRIIQLQYQRNDVIINAVEGKHVDKSLNTIRKDFIYEVPTYETMIEEQYNYMNVKKEIYWKLYNC